MLVRGYYPRTFKLSWYTPGTNTDGRMHLDVHTDEQNWGQAGVGV